MRRQGKIAKWNDERGFGFISSEGDDSIFVHISAFPGSDRRPSVNEAVSYTLAFDSQGRPQAKDVRFIVGRSTAWPTRKIPRSGVTVQITFAMSPVCLSRTRDIGMARDELVGSLLCCQHDHVWLLLSGQEGCSERRMANS